MKQETVVELLKIAAALTETAIKSGSARTASFQIGQPQMIETTFKDCLNVVVEKFDALSTRPE